MSRFKILVVAALVSVSASACWPFSMLWSGGDAPKNNKPFDVQGKLFGTGHWSYPGWDIAVDASPSIVAIDDRGKQLFVANGGFAYDEDHHAHFKLSIWRKDAPEEGWGNTATSVRDKLRKTHGENHFVLTAVQSAPFPGFGFPASQFGAAASSGRWAYAEYTAENGNCVYWLELFSDLNSIDALSAQAAQSFHGIAAAGPNPPQCR